MIGNSAKKMTLERSGGMDRKQTIFSRYFILLSLIVIGIYSDNCLFDLLAGGTIK